METELNGFFAVIVRCSTGTRYQKSLVNAINQNLDTITEINNMKLTITPKVRAELKRRAKRDHNGSMKAAIESLCNEAWNNIKGRK